MMPLPKQYDFLNDERAPRILIEALKLYGTIEGVGDIDNPDIVKWAQEIGKPISLNYQHDSTPWCGLFMAICAKRAGLELPNSPLWALSWSNWGDKVNVPMLGDVLTFKRDKGGHVAIYVGEDRTHYHILGGNQRDEVCIVRKPKLENGRPTLYSANRTKWKIAQPENIRRVFLSNSGIMAGSEA